MNSRYLFLPCVLLIAALSACGKKEQVEVQTAQADFVQNSGDEVTADVWGVQFEVASPVGTSAGSTMEGMLHSDSGQNDALMKLTMGDDVTVLLEKRGTDTIAFTFNEEKHGTLEEGDFVTIDEDRIVMVNGFVRDVDDQ